MIIKDNWKQIKDYLVDLDQMIGQGSFSKVYIGKNISNNHKVAIKIVQREKINQNQENYKCIINEIQVLKQLSHPNIIKIYDVYQTKNNIYIISEYCNYKNLEEYMKDHSFLNETQLKDILIDIFKGFQYLLEKKLVHRDIKPENIFIHKDEKKLTFKIGDFGFAQQDTEIQNQVIGTPYYMSPQKIQGNQYTNKAEIWSIGVLIHMLLTGTIPWISKTFKDLKNEINSPFTLNQNLSKNSEQLISQCLQIEEDQRIDWNHLFNHEFLNDDLKSTIDTNQCENNQQSIFKSFILENYNFIINFDNQKLQFIFSHFIHFLIKQINYQTNQFKNIKEKCKNVRNTLKAQENLIINNPYFNEYFKTKFIYQKIEILQFLLEQQIRMKIHLNQTTQIDNLRVLKNGLLHLKSQYTITL